MKFFVGLICGLFCLGGFVGWQQVQRQKDPCLARCGEGTVCEQAVCVVDKPAVEPKKKKKKRRRWRRRKPRRLNSENLKENNELKKAGPSELQVVSRGPSLGGTEVIQAGDISEGTRELSQAEVSARFRKLDGRIVACIDRARGQWDIRQGKVVVGFRLERSGKVKKVKVTAPAALQQGGIQACITPLVKGLSYPPSGRALVMSYPYSLR